MSDKQTIAETSDEEMKQFRTPPGQGIFTGKFSLSVQPFESLASGPRQEVKSFVAKSDWNSDSVSVARRLRVSSSNSKISLSRESINFSKKETLADRR
jgi:hypothetical protein